MKALLTFTNHEHLAHNLIPGAAPHKIDFIEPEIIAVKIACQAQAAPCKIKIHYEHPHETDNLNIYISTQN